MTSYSSVATREPLDSAVNKMLKNTFIAVACMLALTAGTAYFGGPLVPATGGAVIGLFVVGLLAMLGAYLGRKSGLGLVCLAIFSGVMGLMIGPAVTVSLADPNLTMVLIQALGLTVAGTVGISAYAITTRKDFSYLGGFLFASLLILLAAGILNLFLKSPLLDLVHAGGGAILFSVYLLYDVSRIVNKGETNYIVAAVSIYLDILNLFLSLWRLLGGGSSNK